MPSALRKVESIESDIFTFHGNPRHTKSNESSPERHPVLPQHVFHLELQDGNIVRAGDLLQGRVNLNLAKAIAIEVEAIDVEVKGSVATSVEIEDANRNRQCVLDKNVIFEDTVCLWTRETAKAAPGSPYVALPFEILLPADLPPTYSHDRLGNTSANITYSVKTIGYRRGGYKQKLLESQELTLVKPDIAGLQVRDILGVNQGSWPGQWRSWNLTNSVKEFVWSTPCEVNASIFFPDIPVWPVATPIPIRVHLTTFSKLHDRKHLLQSRKSSKSAKIYPLPPTTSKSVQIALRQVTQMSARGRTGVVQKKLYPFPEWNPNSDEPAILAQEPEDPIWVAEESGKGRWKQMSKIDGILTLPPLSESFSHSAAQLEYRIKVSIKLDKNTTMKGEWPVVISSGF